MTARVPLLICSLGNPGHQYADTLHSAGHTLLNHLAKELGFSQWRSSRDHGKGLICTGSSQNWTLWQSQSYMNESGIGLRKAWDAWSRAAERTDGKLIVVYDELESTLGTVKVRTQQGLAARGHNGVKSVIARMGNTPFVRVGIGIGRPVSRESDDVAAYVLRKMTRGEKDKIEGSTSVLLQKLMELERG